MFYKISRGLVPAIQPTDYITPVENKRKRKAKTFENCVTNNFVTSQQFLNNNCYTPIIGTTKIYKNSFFPRTISHWNQLEDTPAPTLEAFKKHLKSINL